MAVGKEGEHCISPTDFDNDGLFIVIKHLMSTVIVRSPRYTDFFLSLKIKQNGIAAWQNKLANKAKDAVMAKFRIRDINTIEDQAAFVSAMLGPDPTDLTKKDHPFLWQSTNDSFNAKCEVSV